MDDLREYINKLRYDFTNKKLDESEVDKQPMLQFEKWFKEVVEAKVHEPNAMVLSTATVQGKPSARVVLLRNFSEKGLVFYTNYDSKKSCDIQQNPLAAITFFWPELERQVRIEGTLEKQTAEESDVYFNSRPYESKIGAHTSPQSQVIENRAVLDKLYSKNIKKYPTNVPRPAYWGGYILKPASIEFWQGRPSRLHDRILYTLQANKWLVQRLAP